MNAFPLPLFPEGALTSSVITTVWIGVFVIAFFNLRLGWVLSGLVVPGYLVPLLMNRPVSVAVILVEAAITYFLVAFLSEYLGRIRAWSSLFGRDRFFALILFSVLVRLTFDGWLLPAFGAWMQEQYQWNFDYRASLHSFGLIVVALAANQFWKTGLWRGMSMLLITTALTYLIVRLVLMPFTNFFPGGLAFMYEDVAASMLASPKAYIILVTVAYVASRMNLRYGWDFSGILIPSLLALQWYFPLKILVTFVEAFVILALARLVLRLPLFAHTNMEGARQILLFFNISFVYKLLLGHVLLWWFPEVKITDYFAFGYLLATLIAIKMYEKEILGRMTRSLLQTSLVGAAAASLVGFGLTLMPFSAPGPAASPRDITEVVRASDASLSDHLRQAGVELYQYEGPALGDPPTAFELDRFRQALGRLLDYARGGDSESLSRGAALLGGLGYELVRVEQRYLYLREIDRRRGWGYFVVDTRATNELLIQVPAPREEQGTLQAGGALLRSLDARALAVAGTARDLDPDGAMDVLQNAATMFARAQKAAGGPGVLQVRGHDAGRRRRADPTPAVEDTLWVDKRLPAALNLQLVEALVEGLEVRWGDRPAGPNILREISTSGFAELVLRAESIRRVVGRSAAERPDWQRELRPQRIDGFLLEWLSAGKERIAAKGSDAYVPPSPEELLYLDEEILTPLLRVARDGDPEGDWTPAAESQLAAIVGAAEPLGYELIEYEQRPAGRRYLILAESLERDTRHWGTYVLRVGGAGPYVVEVPRPLFEVNSFELGASLFERLTGRALLIAGAHPEANRDGSADVVDTDNLQSVFSLAHQITVRHSGERPLVAVQARAYGYEPGEGPTADSLISCYGDFPPAMSPRVAALTRELSRGGLGLKWVNGEPSTAGYEGGGIAQSLYVEASRNHQFCVVWVSPEVRQSYREQSRNRILNRQFLALGVKQVERDVRQWALNLLPGRGRSVAGGLVEAVQHYIETWDIVALADLMEAHPGLVFERVIDRDSRQAFLAALSPATALLMLANLAPGSADSVTTFSRDGDAAGQIERFIHSRRAMLLFGDAP